MGNGIAAALLDGVAQRVAEVQKLALSVFPLVLTHHGGLDLHIAPDHFIHMGTDVPGHEKAVEIPIGNEAVLEGLRHAAGKGVRRQGPEGIRIADHHFWLVEGPRQILPRRQIDGGLPSHGGIGRGQEGGGHLDIVHPSLVDSGGKPRHVPRHAAPQGNYKIGTGQFIFRQKFQHPAEGPQIFALLPRREGVEAHPEARLLKGAAHNGGIELFHRGIGDEGAGPGTGRSRDQLPGLFQQAGADVDRIGRGRIDGNGLHKNHSLVRISRLWLVAPMRSGRSQMERWYLT